MFTLKRFLILVLFLSLTACSGLQDALASPTPIPPTFTPPPPTATLPPMALTVNGEGITLEEFNAELARYQTSQTALGNHPSDQDAAGPVIDEFVNELLLAQGAQEAGFTLDDTGLQARIDALAAKVGGADQLSAWQQAHGYTDQSFRVALRRQIAAAWMRDKIMTGVPTAAEQVHIRQILLYNQDNAQKIWDRLQAGDDFDTLAAQVDPVTRGDIGWFPRGYLPEKSIEDAAFSLEAGKYSNIIQDKVGFHILKLIERQDNRPLSPDQILALQNHALDDWIASRRQQSTIVLAPK